MTMDRRSLLLAAGAAGAAASAAPMMAQAAQLSLKGPYLDLTTGKGNAVAHARLNGNLDETKEKYGDGSGAVFAVQPGGPMKPICGFEIFSVGRVHKQPDGSFRFLHREVVYYTDLRSGEIMTEFDNPLTKERVKVVPVVNDPWNELIEEFEPRPPSYGGLIKDNSARKPLTVDWRIMPDGSLRSQRGIDLYYPATLQPDKWPRESAGKMNQVSEHFTTFCSLADMQNPKLTSVKSHGVWVRVTPWMPWMLMGQADGHMIYDGSYSNYDDINLTKRNVLDFTAKYYPQMSKSPTDWNAKSLSSLENYALTQTPQPVK
jgi:hypothetical protein